MDEEPPARDDPDAVGRRRKPTFAQRREQRAAVDDVAEVLDAAARYLEARPRSVAEVQRKLGGMGYRAALVDEVVTRLEALGYLDDAAFARSWVESRDRAKPRGEHALRRELTLRGVDRSLVDAVLEERRGVGAGEVPVDPDTSAAERLLHRKLPAILREPDPRRRRQRAYALLARSGFSPDVCGSVSRDILASLDPDPGSAPDDDPPHA